MCLKVDEVEMKKRNVSCSFATDRSLIHVLTWKNKNVLESLTSVHTDFPIMDLGMSQMSPKTLKEFGQYQKSLKKCFKNRLEHASKKRRQ